MVLVLEGDFIQLIIIDAQMQGSIFFLHEEKACRDRRFGDEAPVQVIFDVTGHGFGLWKRTKSILCPKEEKYKAENQ